MTKRMISEEKARLIESLLDIRPDRPAKEKNRRLQVAIDEAIRLLKLDLDEIMQAEYIKGYKDGKQDAFLAQQNLKVRTTSEYNPC